MEPYNHKDVEKKWQDKWEAENLYATQDDSKKPKYYVLDMFPYPSGAGLHAGHPEGYTATDIVTRYMRARGYNVLHPMGWDAFGLPTENYAIKVGRNPKEVGDENIKNFKRQIQSFGFSYDWSKEINTSSPEYYKWTQWLFLKLYEKGLAYKKEAPVNWCESCKTVLANEQVEDGRCERCKNEVVQKELEQWFFKTTEYTQEYIDDLEKLDWPEKLKAIQKNWIGRSEGAHLEFDVEGSDAKIKVFTTRPDTLFGATYMVLAPEHVLVDQITTDEQKESVENYKKEAQKKSELERTELAKEKTGVFTGAYAINPANGEKIPVWIADYVLSTYGTGAIMAVPAHDERDYEFAKQYDLPIVQVIEGDMSEGVYIGDGKLMNSGEFDGMDWVKAKKEVTQKVGGALTINYRLRDWLVSRQRYWGAPIPIIYCENCGTVPVPEKDLPVVLPNDVDFTPTGESPLASSENFINVKCPKCEGDAKREADTLDTFVDSSWYFLRYPDANNTEEAFSKEAVEKWMPVDLYVGGVEHAVLHLLYARFITKALRDMGYVSIDEPFTKLRNQGLIMAEDGRKMSKSLGNVVNPDDVVNEYGADVFRMYEMFMGPLEDNKPWNTKGIVGIARFVNNVWQLQEKISGDSNEDIIKISHKTLKKVTEDIEGLHFNTAISAMMILAKEMGKAGSVGKPEFEMLLMMLAPFAPHVCEELWGRIGNGDSITLQEWPQYDESMIVDDEMTIAVQVNGKVRGDIVVSADASDADILSQAKAVENVKKYIDGKDIKKEIYVKNKLVSLVI